MATPFHVTFVCSGNICRSPYAEALLSKFASDEGWADKIRVTSRGTLPLHDVPAHEYALQFGARHSLYLLTHRSRPIDEEHLETCDLVLGMASEHVEKLRDDHPEHAEKIYLLCSYPERDAQGEEIPDPMGQKPEVFREVFDKIEVAIQPLLHRLRSLVGAT